MRRLVFTVGLVLQDTVQYAWTVAGVRQVAIHAWVDCKAMAALQSLLLRLTTFASSGAAVDVALVSMLLAAAKMEVCQIPPLSCSMCLESQYAACTWHIQ